MPVKILTERPDAMIWHFAICACKLYALNENDIVPKILENFRYLPDAYIATSALAIIHV